LRRSIILYGLSLAILIFVLKILEYRYLVHDLSLQFYIGLIAVFFAALGAWVGWRLTRGKKIQRFYSTPEFKANEDKLIETGLSRRELDVLELMSKGNSNQEIADTLFLSLNTVKTHSSNVFLKLDVKRRTQAIQRAKELHLIP
jgi:NarL family two-component system response regulator LiaR